MTKLEGAVERFLAQRRIAVAGVSRSDRGAAANIVYRKLRDSGYEVFPVNPNAREIEGDTCYSELASIPGGIDGVVIATHPDVTSDVVEQCADLGIRHVWMHRSLGQGSVSDQAVELCRQRGISVIPGACPMMFCQPVDFPHKCLRWVLRLSGGMPKVS